MLAPLPLGLNDLPGLNVKVIQSNMEAQRHRFARTIKGEKLEALNQIYKEQSYPNQEQCVEELVPEPEEQRQETGETGTS